MSILPFPPYLPFNNTKPRFNHLPLCSTLVKQQNPLLIKADDDGEEEDEEEEAALATSVSVSDVRKYSEFLHNCINNKSHERGKRLHQHLVSKCSPLLKHPMIQAKFITFFSACRQIPDARNVFENGELSDDPSVWTAMVTGYSINGLPREALSVFARMQWEQCLLPDSFAFSSALKSCFQLSDFQFGRAIHAQIVKRPEAADAVVENALVAMYVKLRKYREARLLFGGMPRRNIVSWNAMIAGFVEGSLFTDAMELFGRMQREGVGFNWATLTAVLPACARSNSLQRGREIHAQMIKAKNKSLPEVSVKNALVDMYAKCGDMKHAHKLFAMMPKRDLTSWNIMITGYAVNGRADQALRTLDEMVTAGFRPDGITFIAVLSGCAQAGYLNEGLRYFESMELEYKIKPSVEHYSCTVDLLGRAGRIHEAVELVRSMPMSPSNSVWGSLLNSCRMHGNVEMGEIVANRLFELEPGNPGNYLLLANTYATAGRRADVERIRMEMEEKGMKKELGHSKIEIGGRVQAFGSGTGNNDLQLRESKEFKELSARLKDAAKDVAVLPTGNELSEAENWVCGHSERLALAYGLIHSAAGSPIRITKNLRVCLECHIAMKVVSRIEKRVIVLRDGNRYHRFEDGECSCRDYW